MPVGTWRMGHYDSQLTIRRGVTVMGSIAERNQRTKASQHLSPVKKNKKRKSSFTPPRSERCRLGKESPTCIKNDNSRDWDETLNLLVMMPLKSNYNIKTTT